MFLLYIINRLRLKMYFEIKWSKLKIEQYNIYSKRLTRDIWMFRKYFSGHWDVKSKTGESVPIFRDVWQSYLLYDHVFNSFHSIIWYYH
jgi:hypothetical protein